MLKKILTNCYNSAARLNEKNILSLLEKNANARLVDLGCDDGKWTIQIAKTIGSSKIYGIEIVNQRIEQAKKRGIKVKKADLNMKLPFGGDSFDVVHANQVIEHLYDTDNFVSEIYRILKPGGYAIISTENLSSWHNIFALIFGWQPFSMTNFTSKGSIGNPFSLWRGRKSIAPQLDSWQHMRLFAYRGLKELFEQHSFSMEKIITAGYYPLPASFAAIDTRHGHFISIKVRKNK